MKCPFCNKLEDKVIDSRNISEGTIIRRRRECLDCHQRFTTYERVFKYTYTVIKNDGREEMFDRVKLMAGIIKACEKRPISTDRIEQMVDEIEARLHEESQGKAVKSEILGNLVMAELRAIDEVAYLRFASVYRKFEDAQAFIEEIKGKLEEKEEKTKCL